MQVQSPGASYGVTQARVMLFVDFWNFQLQVNDCLKEAGLNRRINWNIVPEKLTEKLQEVMPGTVSHCSIEGTHVYISCHPTRDNNLKKWADNYLRFIPGVQVSTKQQKHKKHMRCDSCSTLITECPKCHERLEKFEEKGVDVSIATDMVMYAWEQAYDIAVLASSDTDFIPVVQFLGRKGLKVAHVGAMPHSNQLGAECWLSLNLKDFFRELLLDSPA